MWMDTNPIELIKRIFERAWLELRCWDFLISLRELSSPKTIFPEFINSAMLALGIDLVLTATVLRLDASYIEAADAASRRFHNLKHLRRKGATKAKLSKRSASGRSLPSLPWLSGAGPIMWRQIIDAMRTSRKLIGALIIFFIIIGGPAFSVLTIHTEGIQRIIFVGFIGYGTLILSLVIPFGFRADIDHIARFKALPIGAFSIVGGELMLPVLFMTLLHWLALGGIAILDPAGWFWYLSGALFALPLNISIFGIQNLLFLLFPVSNAQRGVGGLWKFRQTNALLSWGPSLLPW